MNKRVLIVEDEPLIAKDLSFILGDIGLQEVTIEMSFDDAFDTLSRNTFDLILLDINLSSEKDGIDLAHHINENIHTPFIFITSYYNPTTVARAKVTRPLAYILKPFNKHDIRINVEMGLYKVDQSKEDSTIYFKEKNRAIQLTLSEIQYLEAKDNYTQIVTKERELLISQTLKSVLETLPKDQFVRTHKSYAVRISGVTMIKGSNVFVDEHQVPIGRAFKTEFKEQIQL